MMRACRRSSSRAALGANSRMTTVNHSADHQEQTATHRSAWRWLAGRWWVVALTTVLGIVAGTFLGLRQDPSYETSTIVVAVETDLEAETFGDLGESTFATDTVLEPVVTELGLGQDWQTLVATGRLEATAVPGAVALEITGRSADPETARDLAVTAATSFAFEARNNDLGTFELFGTSPTVDDSATPVLWVVGAVAGMLLGLGVLLLVFAVRQPLVNVHQAEREYPADVAVSVFVRGGRAENGGAWEISPPGTASVIAQRMRSVLPAGATLWVLLAGRRRSRDVEGRVLARSLLSELAARGLRTALFRLDAKELVPTGEVPAGPVHAAVAIVVQGAPAAAVRALDDSLRAVAEAEAPRLLVFLHPVSRRHRRRVSAPRGLESRGVGQRRARRWRRRGAAPAGEGTFPGGPSPASEAGWTPRATAPQPGMESNRRGAASSQRPFEAEGGLSGEPEVQSDLGPASRPEQPGR
jgi:hypothetical protein